MPDFSEPLPGTRIVRTASGGDWEILNGVRIRQNVWGNWQGYRGRQRVVEFGLDYREAREWMFKQGPARYTDFSLRPRVAPQTHAPSRGKPASEEPMSKKQSSPTINAHPFYQIGKGYLVRTVTYAQTGRLVAITDTELVFDNAAWIADTGRFANAVADVNFSEIEPFPGLVLVNRGAISDVCEIDVAKLPRTQK